MTSDALPQGARHQCVRALRAAALLATVSASFAPIPSWGSLHAQSAAVVQNAPVPPSATAAADSVQQPLALYLTWQRDPTRSMTVHWHTSWRVGHRDPVLEYRANVETDEWVRVAGTVHPMPFTDRMVHTVEITELRPDTRYQFRLGALTTTEQGEWVFTPDGEVHQFRTLPATLTRPVQFVSGGDIYGQGEVFAAINRAAAARNPDFALMGGDIAYDNGRPVRAERWFEFLSIWQETMVTRDGRLIPMIPAIGNHEAHGDSYDLRGGAPERGLSPERAPFFFSLFSFPGKPGYNVLDAGDYLSLVVLDSYHTNTVHGEQTEWLRRTLESRGSVPYVIPMYHVPAYPSHRAFSGPVSVAIREHWVPLFDTAAVRFAFENHDHTYKVTHPLRGSERHVDGTRYLGDGAWGVTTRETTPLADAPYLERAQSRNHLFFVTLHGDRAEVSAFDQSGSTFDSLTIRPRPVSDEAPTRQSPKSRR